MKTKDIRALEASSCNNHIDSFYFPNFFIRKHIDKVDYSSNVNTDEKIIFRIIESIGYKRLTKHKLSRGKYLLKDTYRHPDDISTVEVIYQLKPEVIQFHELKHGYCRLPAFLVTVHDPTQEIINLLSSSCVSHGIKLTVSKIELAYDFYDLSSRDRIILYDFLKSHLLLKHSRSKPSEKYLTTYYANQIKYSSKGLKVYLRPDHRNKRIVRLELTLKRPLLRKLRIDPLLKTIDSVNPLDFFLFMSVDENKLLDHLKWKSRRRHKNDVSRNKFLHDELLERHVENYVHGFLLEAFPLMGKIVNLKSESGIVNYSRFLVPHKDFTQMFIEKTRHQGFLPSKTGLKRH
jgi:hypothetical protein